MFLESCIFIRGVTLVCSELLCLLVEIEAQRGQVCKSERVGRLYLLGKLSPVAVEMKGVTSKVFNLAIIITLVKQTKIAIFFGEKLAIYRGFVVCLKRSVVYILLGNQCLTESVYTVIIQD